MEASGDASVGPLIWPVYCWEHKAEFLHTQLSRSSCFNAENSLDIISHYKMRLVSSETQDLGKQDLGEEAGWG